MGGRWEQAAVRGAALLLPACGASGEENPERLLRLRSRWLAARGVVMCGVVAVGANGGCQQMVGSLIENSAFAPRAEFQNTCRPAASVMRPLPDSPATPYGAYDDPPLGRGDVAVVVFPRLHAGWTLAATRVEERPLPGLCAPEAAPEPGGLGQAECQRFGVLPGRRTVGVSLRHPGSGSAWNTTKVKGAEIGGLVVFPARAGGLYSIHACQPHGSAETLFWVRDEATLACVSAVCPSPETPEKVARPDGG